MEDRKIQGREKEPAAEYSLRQSPASLNPICFDPDVCIGCNRCVQPCQCDILLPSGQKGNPPLSCIPESAITAAPVSWNAPGKARFPCATR